MRHQIKHEIAPPYQCSSWLDTVLARSKSRRLQQIILSLKMTDQSRLRALLSHLFKKISFSLLFYFICSIHAPLTHFSCFALGVHRKVWKGGWGGREGEELGHFFLLKSRVDYFFVYSPSPKRKVLQPSPSDALSRTINSSIEYDGHAYLIRDLRRWLQWPLMAQRLTPNYRLQEFIFHLMVRIYIKDYCTYFKFFCLWKWGIRAHFIASGTPPAMHPSFSSISNLICERVAGSTLVTVGGGKVSGASACTSIFREHINMGATPNTQCFEKGLRLLQLLVCLSAHLEASLK
jgi:hypothetical protein